QRWTSNAAGGGMPVANDSRFVGVEETFQVGALRHAAALAEVDGTDKTSVSVIGSFGTDPLITGGRLRTCLPENPCVYLYSAKENNQGKGVAQAASGIYCTFR
ncbi:hypothetical protein DYB26_015998, partial [Aphanomyces astaci]